MRFLRRLFGGRPKLTHPVFGPVLFFDFGAKGSYWEAEREVEGRTIAVIIEGDETGPTDDQVAFYRTAIGDLDALFQRVAGIIGPEYASWVGAPLPERWRDAFAFAGITIPRGGEDTGPWDVSFDCLADRAGHMFTVAFERGQPTTVTIDG
jgi:hypothetical protein